MAQFFVMPQASPTMTVGVVGKWLAPEGSALVPSQAIASVETDKATMEIEVFDKGVLLKHLAHEGQEVPPGQPIAIIGLRADEDISALVAEYAGMTAGTPAAAPLPAPAAATPVAMSFPDAIVRIPSPPPMMTKRWSSASEMNHASPVQDNRSRERIYGHCHRRGDAVDRR